MTRSGPTIALVLTATFVLGFVLGLTIVPDLLSSWRAGLDDAEYRPTAVATASGLRRS